MARPVFIIDGSRTPFLKARSGPGPFTPVDLAVQCGRPLLARQPFAPDAFDQVMLGCVNVIADEMNPARVAALRLGMGELMVAFTEQVSREFLPQLSAEELNRVTAMMEGADTIVDLEDWEARRGKADSAGPAATEPSARPLPTTAG